MLHIDPDITAARQPPPSFYTSDEAYRACQERVLARSWQWAGDIHEHPGAAAWPITLLPGCLDEPVVLTHQDSGGHRALVNACTHRGHRLLEGPLETRTLRCRYHGRRFDRSGRCLGQPYLDEAPGFPCPSDDLPELPLARWRRFLFCGVDPAFPFEEIAGPLERRLGFLPLDAMVVDPAGCRDYAVEAPWQLYVDNYLEGLHAPFVHPGLSATLDLPAYSHELLPWGTLQIGAADADSLAFELPEGHPEHGQRVAAFWFFVFPNLMVNAYPWGLTLNLVEPQGPSRTRVRYWTGVYRPDLVGQGAGGDLDTVELEDEAVVEAVAVGLRSRRARTGGYVPGQEEGLHHVHRLLARLLSAP